MIYRIRGYHGGLGDQLQFSTLPEELTKLGHEVYLLKDCDQVQPFRNDEIKQIVWLDNPYIKGEIEGYWNMGDIPGTRYKNTENDFIKNWERLMHIEPKNSFPKIYYKPKKIEGIENLIELSSLTLRYNSNSFNIEEIKRSMKHQGTMAGFKFIQIFTPNQHNRIVIPGIEQVPLKNIFELADYIYSCKTFISLNSGSHALACALPERNFRQYCMLPSFDYNWIMKDKKFIFPGVNYIAV